MTIRNEVISSRPTTSDEFAGTETVRVVRKLRDEVRRGSWAGPAAFVGPSGRGKTSAARYVMRCVCCASFAARGEPCELCEGCRSQVPAFNGEVHQFWHGAYGCAALDRKALVRLCRRALRRERAVLFFDQAASLARSGAQDVLLEFAEEFRGVLLFSVTTGTGADTLQGMLGVEFAERVRELRLPLPTTEEITEALYVRTGGWGIGADVPTLKLLVLAARQSFRGCLKVLAEVPRGESLTLQHIQGAFGLDDGWENDFLGA